MEEKNTKIEAVINPIMLTAVEVSLFFDIARTALLYPEQLDKAILETNTTRNFFYKVMIIFVESLQSKIISREKPTLYDATMISLLAYELSWLKNVKHRESTPQEEKELNNHFVSLNSKNKESEKEKEEPNKESEKEKKETNEEISFIMKQFYDFFKKKVEKSLKEPNSK